MCDCNQKREKALIGRTNLFKGQGNIPVESIFLEEQALVPVGQKTEWRTFSTIKLVAGSRSKNIPLVHNYCPFCGEQYSDYKLEL